MYPDSYVKDGHCGLDSSALPTNISFPKQVRQMLVSHIAYELPSKTHK